MNRYVPRGRGRGGPSMRSRFPSNNPFFERNKELRRNLPTSRLQYDESHVNTVRHPRMARQNQEEMQDNFQPRPRMPRENRQNFDPSLRHPRIGRQNQEQIQENFPPRPRTSRENGQNFERSSRFENPNQEVNMQVRRPFRRSRFQQQYENSQRRLAQGDMNHNFEQPFERRDFNGGSDDYDRPSGDFSRDHDNFYNHNDEEFQEGLNHRFSNVRLGSRGRRGDHQFNGRPTRFEGYIQGPNQPNLQRGSGRRGFRQPRSFGEW